MHPKETELTVNVEASALSPQSHNLHHIYLKID